MTQRLEKTGIPKFVSFRAFSKGVLDSATTVNYKSKQHKLLIKCFFPPIFKGVSLSKGYCSIDAIIARSSVFVQLFSNPVAHLPCAHCLLRATDAGS